MAHDSTVDDTEEPHTASRLRTDGGEAEAAADETQESTDEGEQSRQESTDESDTQDEAQQETADESDDQDAADEPATIEADDEAVAEQTGDVGVEPHPADETEDESTESDENDESDDSEQSTPSLDGEGDTASIIQIRNQVIELSTDVIGRGLDGIIEVTRNDNSWRAVVEIIERRSVPDTQDILGQYEIELDEGGEVIGYRRLEKYRRSDTGPNEH